MIQNVLCKNPWLDQKLEVHLFRELWKTFLNTDSLKNKDSTMKIHTLIDNRPLNLRIIHG